MTDEEMIKQIADEYELPAPQVALIWSVVAFDCVNYGESNEEDYHYFSYRVQEFIQENMK
jgi:hypothetical protein